MHRDVASLDTARQWCLSVLSALRPWAATGIASGAASSRGGEEKTMRKILALVMIALLAMTIALAVIGCGQKKEEATETTPPPGAETSMDTTSMMSDTSMNADTSMSH